MASPSPDAPFWLFDAVAVALDVVTAVDVCEVSVVDVAVLSSVVVVVSSLVVVSELVELSMGAASDMLVVGTVILDADDVV